MKRIAATAALLAGILAAAAAQADTYKFSYSFDPLNTSTGAPVTITGTFDGTLESGDLIDNISNASLWINGTAYTGLLNVTNGAMTGNAVISADVAKSDFAFFDDGFNNYFALFAGQASGLDYNLVDTMNNAVGGVESASNERWTLTAATVPEPNSFALLGAGLIAFAAAALRRRKQA